MSHSHLICEWGMPKDSITQGTFGLVDADGHCWLVCEMNEIAQADTQRFIGQGGSFSLALLYHPHSTQSHLN